MKKVVRVSKNMLVLALSASMTMTPYVSKAEPLSGISQQEQDKEREKIVLATQVAENYFYIKQLQNQLEQAKLELDGSNENSSLDNYSKIMAGISIAFLVGTVYLGKKAFSFKDSRTIFLGFGATISGLISLGTGFDAAQTGLASFIVRIINKKEIKNRITEAQKQLGEIETEAASNLEKLKAIDPDINLKVARALQNTNASIPRFVEIRSQLAQAKSDLSTQTTELGFSGFFAATSLLGLIKGTKASKAGSAVVTLLLSGWAYKNYSERENALKTIENLEKELGQIESEYKQSLISALTGT